MINKRLRLWMIFRGVEYLSQHFFDKLQVRLLFKTSIKGQERSTKFEAISSHFKLVKSMYVDYMEFDAGATGTFTEPHKKVFLFSLLKVHDVVATPFKAKFVNNRGSLFPINFGLLFHVWNHAGNVFNQVAHASCNFTSDQKQSSLTIFPLFR
jgi:hypothetical protein